MIARAIHWLLHHRLALSVALLATSLVAAAPNAKKDSPLTYPAAHRGDVVDTYHGVKIADPYRWLEEPDAKPTRNWIDAQNKLTFGFLKKLPQRTAIKNRLTELWNYERFGMPLRRGGQYFFSRNDGLQNQSVLYTADSLDGEPRVLLDPNKLSKDGTVSLSRYRPSEDGRLLAYGLAQSGSDWQTWRIRDVVSGKDLADELKWIKFSGAAWTPDGKGLYYSRYAEPKNEEEFTGTNYFQKLYYHRLGDPQEKDSLIYERPDEKTWGFGSQVTEDGKFLVIHVWRGSEPKNQIFIKRLGDKDAPVTELITGFDAEYDLIGTDDDTFYFKTDLDAPRSRVIAIDLTKPERKHWQELIPQSDDVLQSVSYTGGKLFLDYLKNAHSQIKVYSTTGKFEREVKLPGLGSAGGFGGRKKDTETFYGYTGYTSPRTIYRYDIATGKSEVYRAPKVKYDPQQFETRQIFYKSKDGTRVSMFITHKKGLSLDGTNPTLLYGYGGFNISLTPHFSVSSTVWMELGGVLAIPNLRGGGEYGRDWHEGGMKANKQNVFDDFIAAAQWLIDNKYTSSKHLAIAGGSNGGLLVGACMTQRPELFAAAMPEVGVMDMLRYHKFTIGWAWVSEYGSADDAEQFKVLRAYSPLHNIKPDTHYPATMIITADHDDRVVPAHSFKFAAELQRAQAGDAPVLIRIETKAGHGAGKPTDKQIAVAADRWAFLVKVLGIEK